MERLHTFNGKVKSYKAVTKNRVQVELYDTPGIFELFIDQSWVLSRNDRVSLVGYRDDTGKYVCYAYSNKSKDIKGWNYKESAIGAYFLIAFSMVFVTIGFLFFPPHLLAFIITGAGFFWLFSIKRANKLYASSRELLE